MSYQVALTMVSRNEKTGPIPVSTTTKEACPNDCPFLAGGCYAKGGPLAIYWGKVTNKTAGMAWHDFTKAIAKLPRGILWRHNQAGDLPGNGHTIDAEALSQLVRANRGKRGFTYTHYNATQVASNAEAIAKANAEGFTINLSANNPAHADQLAGLGIAPVVVVLPATVSGKQTLETPKGRKIVVCPATYRDDVTCASCGLCQRQREAIVGFPAHGASKRKASAIAEA